MHTITLKHNASTINMLVYVPRRCVGFALLGHSFVSFPRFSPSHLVCAILTHDRVAFRLGNEIWNSDNCDRIATELNTLSWHVWSAIIKWTTYWSPFELFFDSSLASIDDNVCDDVSTDMNSLRLTIIFTIQLAFIWSAIHASLFALKSNARRIGLSKRNSLKWNPRKICWKRRETTCCELQFDCHSLFNLNIIF